MEAFTTVGRIIAVVALLSIGTIGCRPTAHTRLDTPSGEESTAAAGSRVPSVEGIWTGKWMRQTCKEAGGAVGVACRNIPDEQSVLLRLTQEGSSTQGTLQLGTLETGVTGSVRADGSLILNGRHEANAHTFTIRSWRSTIEDHAMTGTFAFTIAPDDDALGTVNVTAVLDSVVRKRH